MIMLSISRKGRLGYTKGREKVGKKVQLFLYKSITYERGRRFLPHTLVRVGVYSPQWGYKGKKVGSGT